MRQARFGTYANELMLDEENGEYGLFISLGTKDKDEAEKLADELTEFINQNSDPEIKN